MLNFVKREASDSAGKYDKYDIYDIDPNTNTPYGIGSLVRGCVFEHDKYHCYKPEELIEIAEFIKQLMKSGLVNMLNFVKCENRGDVEYIIYATYKGQEWGIGKLLRGNIFENDKYHCYKPEELIEIAEFIKKLMGSENANE